MAHGPSVTSGTRAVSPPNGSRAVRPQVTHGSSVPCGSRAVSPQVVYAPSVPVWLTGRQSRLAHGPSVPGELVVVGPRWLACPVPRADHVTSSAGVPLPSGSHGSQPWSSTPIGSWAASPPRAARWPSVPRCGPPVWAGPLVLIPTWRAGRPSPNVYRTVRPIDWPDASPGGPESHPLE